MFLKQDGSVWSTAINLRGDNSPGDLDPKFMQMIESGGADIAACTSYNMVLKQDGSSRS